jgi:archaellum component FlaC
MADPVTPLSWIVDHFNLIGWPALIGVTWKFKGAFDKYLSSVEEVKTKTSTAVQVAENIKSKLDVVQNNHLAHLADDIQGLSKQYERHTELLSSIDKGISVLVDRSSSKRGK